MDRDCNTCINYIGGYCSSWECSHETLEQHDEKIRADAIMEVYKKAEEKIKEQIEYLNTSPQRNGKMWARYMATYLGNIKTACEQLKEKNASNKCVNCSHDNNVCEQLKSCIVDNDKNFDDEQETLEHSYLQGQKEGRADAIKECIDVLKGIDTYVADMVEDIFKLKEQKNDSKRNS